MRDAMVSDLTSHLGYWLRFVSNHVSYAFARKVEGCGVTVAEWVVLRELYGGGAVAPSEVAERLGLTRGAVSKLVDRLCAKGLVDKGPGGRDKRFQAVALTKEGAALVPRLARLADANDAEFFACLNARERAQLVRLMKRIVRERGLKQAPTE